MKAHPVTVFPCSPRRVPGLLSRSWVWAAILLAACLVSRADAAPSATDASFDPQLRLSTYQPKVTRDPFLPANFQVKTATAAAHQADFQLQGLLYDSNDPAAIINNEMVVLNKPTKVLTPKGRVEVTAVEITRRRVVLDVAGAKIELPVDAAGQ